MVDFFETGLDSRILNVLLEDKKTKKNIIWATNNYVQYGFYPRTEIDLNSLGAIGTKAKVIGFSKVDIQTRSAKGKEEKDKRRREKAEVFTPSWVCNEMNNQWDYEWFGVKNVFNTPQDKGWIVNREKIIFARDKNKNWKEYVQAKVIEITCGECPFLVSRYDAVTNTVIPVKDRIGLLDRKLRIVTENTKTKEDWLSWTYKAYKSTYGYEFQGDNLLIGRFNLLLTFIDYYKEYWGDIPQYSELKKIATIISWNIWQMDGFTYKPPYGGAINEIDNNFDDAPTNEYCVIQDWRSKVFKIFKTMKEVKMNEI